MSRQCYVLRASIAPPFRREVLPYALAVNLRSEKDETPPKRGACKRTLVASSAPSFPSSTGQNHLSFSNQVGGHFGSKPSVPLYRWSILLSTSNCTLQGRKCKVSTIGMGIFLATSYDSSRWYVANCYIMYQYLGSYRSLCRHTSGSVLINE